MSIHPMVVDLSHWDPASDYAAVKRAGIAGVIFKATEGTGYTDPMYVSQQAAAKAAGLLWGSYHFANSANVSAQADNFMRYACPDPDELFCLDWEDNSGDVMSADDAKTWIAQVENRLNRPNQCVIYSGNTAKEKIDGKDAFFGARRLWLCQYGNTPSWQQSWDKCWLWQFTDGISGPAPHSIAGIGPCDINDFPPGNAALLASEWASGVAAPPGPVPDPQQVVNVLINAPPGTTVKVRQVSLSPPQLQEAKRQARAIESKGR